MTVNGQINVVLSNLNTLQEMLKAMADSNNNRNWELSQVSLAKSMIAEIAMRKNGGKCHD